MKLSLHDFLIINFLIIIFFIYYRYYYYYIILLLQITITDILDLLKISRGATLESIICLCLTFDEQG